MLWQLMPQRSPGHWLNMTCGRVYSAEVLPQTEMPQVGNSRRRRGARTPLRAPLPPT